MVCPETVRPFEEAEAVMDDTLGAMVFFPEEAAVVVSCFVSPESYVYVVTTAVLFQL